MDFIEQQNVSADGDVPVENVHADADYEEARGKKKKNALNSVRGIWLTKPEQVIMRNHYDRLRKKGIKGKLMTKKLNFYAESLLSKRAKNADGIEELQMANADSDYENGFGKWMYKKLLKTRRADGLENEMSAEGDVTVKPNKFLYAAVWIAIGIGTALFVKHAYDTLKKAKS